MSLTRTKRRSLRAAVNANCKSCIYDESAAGNWRQQVTLCTCTDCFLWDYRPVSSRPLPKSVLESFCVPDDDPIGLRHREGFAKRATVGPGTQRPLNGDTPNRNPVKAPQSVKVGASKRGSPLRNLWATMRGRSAV